MPRADRLSLLACSLLVPALLVASPGCGGRTPLSGPGEGFVPIDDGGPLPDTRPDSGPLPDRPVPPDVEVPDVSSGDALITDDFGPFDVPPSRDAGPAGAAGFSEPIYMPIEGNPTTFVAIGDFDRDGHLDLAVVGGSSVHLFGGFGDGSFELRDRIPIELGASWAVVADLNGDGAPDLLVGPVAFDGPIGGQIVVLLNDGTGYFQEDVPLRTQVPAFGAVVDDFDGDGLVDVVAVCPASQSLLFFPGRGNGRFRPRIDFPSTGQLMGIASGRFNDDGLPDVVFADQANDWLGVLYGEPGNLVNRSTLIGTGATPTGVTMARLAGSDLDDAAVTNYVDGTVSVIRARPRPGEPPFGRTDLEVGGRPVFVTTGDFDADGILDLMVVDQQQSRLVLVRGLGDLSFAEAVPFGIPGNFLTMVAVGDFDEDGLPDLVAPDFQDGINLFLNRR